MLKFIDWNATERRAMEMTLTQLKGSIDDIHATLDYADALDRETGSNLGGYYRDEASVYHREIATRGA